MAFLLLTNALEFSMAFLLMTYALTAFYNDIICGICGIDNLAAFSRDKCSDIMAFLLMTNVITAFSNDLISLLSVAFVLVTNLAAFYVVANVLTVSITICLITNALTAFSLMTNVMRAINNEIYFSSLF